MDRISIAVVLAAILLLAVGTPAFAQESTKPDPAKPGADAGSEAPEAGDEEEKEPLAPVTGEKVRVRIRPGVEMSGVVKERQYEVFKENRYIPVDDPETPGAGLRVYFVTGLNGFLFVRADQIIEVTFSGALTREEGLKLAEGLEAEKRRAVEEKALAAAEMQRRRAAAKAAREKAGDGAGASETPGRPPRAAGGAPGKPVDMSASEKALKIRELLIRFPPEDWKPSRLDEIKRRAIVLDIFPNEEESAFIDNYDLWEEGYEMWRKETGGE